MSKTESEPTHEEIMSHPFAQELKEWLEARAPIRREWARREREERERLELENADQGEPPAGPIVVDTTGKGVAS